MLYMSAALQQEHRHALGCCADADLGAGQHARLHDCNGKVIQYGCHLLANERGRYGFDALNAPRVLCRQRRYGRCSEYAAGCEGLQIRLNARTTSRVASCHCEHHWRRGLVLARRVMPFRHGRSSRFSDAFTLIQSYVPPKISTSMGLIQHEHRFGASHWLERDVQKSMASRSSDHSAG